MFSSKVHGHISPGKFGRFIPADITSLLLSGLKSNYITVSDCQNECHYCALGISFHAQSLLWFIGVPAG